MVVVVVAAAVAAVVVVAAVSGLFEKFGARFWNPYDKDHSILESVLDLPALWETTLQTIRPYRKLPNKHLIYGTYLSLGVLGFMV